MPTNEEQHTQLDHNLTNHPPKSDEVAFKMDAATNWFINVGDWIIDNVPAGREQSIALTKLEELSMWVKAGIARHQ